MLEETAGAETPAAEGVEPEAIDETSAPSTEQQTEADKPSEASAETGDKSGDDTAEKPEKNWASDRIKELTRKRREAERRAERAEQRLKEAQSTDLDGLEYEDQIAERTIRRSRQETLENERTAAQELAWEAFSEGENLARAKYADYDAVTRNPNVPITGEIVELAMDSDVGPELVYHLGKNPQEAARIAALPPKRQAVEIGRLEARLTAPKPVIAPPPDPVTPISGGGSAQAQKDPSKMSMSEYVAWRAKN